MLLTRAGRPIRAGAQHLWVIVNGQLNKAPQTTATNTVAVLGRSADTVQLSIIRNTLVETQGFCARNGVSFQAASLPADGGSLGPFDFGAKNRKRLFRLGERLGASGEAWNVAKPAGQAGA